MAEKYFGYATKTVDGNYTPVQFVSGDDVKVPVTTDSRTAERLIVRQIVNRNDISLEGIILDLTPWVIRGTIPREKLEILE